MWQVTHEIVPSQCNLFWGLLPANTGHMVPSRASHLFSTVSNHFTQLLTLFQPFPTIFNYFTPFLTLFKHLIRFQQFFKCVPPFKAIFNSFQMLITVTTNFNHVKPCSTILTILNCSLQFSTIWANLTVFNHFFKNPFSIVLHWCYYLHTQRDSVPAI